jgi:hypothetical protein
MTESENPSMKVTRTIAGTEYIFDNIRIGDARRMKKDYPEPSDYNVAFIAASLRAGGNAEASIEWVDANLPFFDGAFVELLGAAYEACGMKLEKQTPGEAQPAEVPATETAA